MWGDYFVVTLSWCKETSCNLMYYVVAQKSFLLAPNNFLLS